jgi:hypothetical protein
MPRSCLDGSEQQTRKDGTKEVEANEKSKRK